MRPLLILWLNIVGYIWIHIEKIVVLLIFDEVGTYTILEKLYKTNFGCYM
jgi:hypothetical protein